MRDWLLGNRPEGLDPSVTIRAELETDTRERPVVVITRSEGAKGHPKIVKGVVTVALLVSPDEQASREGAKGWHSVVMQALDPEVLTDILKDKHGVQIMFFKPGRVTETPEGERGWRFAQEIEVWLTVFDDDESE